MTVIAFIDNDGGMMFFGKRLSRDSAAMEDIKKISEGKRIFASPYSMPLFEGFENEIIYDEEFLSKAESGDICFVEDARISDFAEKIDSAYIYSWNRDYPSDFFMDIDFKKDFRFDSEFDFEGSSHENITRRYYVK